MNHSSAPIDIEALAAFNPELASQALPQLYVDGHAELALHWASGLNPFKKISLRPRPEPAIAAPAPGSTPYESPPSYCSLIDLVLFSRDTSSLAVLARDDKIRTTLFGTDDYHVPSVIPMITANLPTHPDFATHLFEQLIHPVKRLNTRYRVFDSGLSDLAKAVVKARKFEWLARLNTLTEFVDGTPMPCDALVRSLLSPLDEEGLRAFMDLGLVSESPWREIAMALCTSSKPQYRAYGSEVLARHFDFTRAASVKDGGDAAKFLKKLTDSALDTDPANTPSEWLDFHMDHGVDPFNSPASHQLSLALRLLSYNWKSLSRLGYGPTSVEELRQNRLARDKKNELLLRQMLARSSAGAEIHFDMSLLPEFLRDSLFGARKADLLTLCVAQGFYRSADALIDAGFDWKFAAGQCSARLKKSHPHDEPDLVELAASYFDALTLRKISVRATNRRDERCGKSSEVAPTIPARAPRRL